MQGYIHYFRIHRARGCREGILKVLISVHLVSEHCAIYISIIVHRYGENFTMLLSESRACEHVRTRKIYTSLVRGANGQ